MTGLVIVMIVIQATLLWVAIAILNQLRRACELLERQPQPQVCAQPYATQASLNYPYAAQAALLYPYAVTPRLTGTGAFAIWCWRGASWELESGSVPVGFQPGKRPSYQGSFVGQRVKSECVRR